MPIFDDVGKYGLKTRHLQKHAKDVDRFYNRTIEGEISDSEVVLKYQKRFLRYRESLFRFLFEDGIPWNNNTGERAIRHLAIQRKISLTFRTSALDYPRISFGAKLRGGGAIPALISPPARCGNRTAVAMAALPTQRGSHAVIHMVGQRHGPHSSREDLGTNLITRHPGIGSSSTRSLRPLGLDRPCDAVFLDPRLNLHFSTRRFSRWSSGRSSQAS